MFLTCYTSCDPNDAGAEFWAASSFVLFYFVFPERRGWDVENVGCVERLRCSSDQKKKKKYSGHMKKTSIFFLEK